MSRKSLTVAAVILLLIATILCVLEYEPMFQGRGDWLHSTSFLIGSLTALFAIGMLAGVGSSNSTVGVAAFAALFLIYGFFLWTFPGWLMTYKLIHWLFVPGPTPAGM